MPADEIDELTTGPMLTPDGERRLKFLFDDLDREAGRAWRR